MEIIALIVFAVLAWVVASTVDSLPNLGQLLVPSRWLLGLGALLLVTWLMRDDP